jgi:hypothetical protein
VANGRSVGLDRGPMTLPVSSVRLLTVGAPPYGAPDSRDETTH